jgi:hypothetical protein
MVAWASDSAAAFQKRLRSGISRASGGGPLSALSAASVAADSGPGPSKADQLSGWA